MTQIPEKPWWQSRTIIGTIVSSVAVIAGMAGYAVDVPGVTELAVGLTALVGNALAWYGRVEATKVINKRQVLPGVVIREK